MPQIRVPKRQPDHATKLVGGKATELPHLRARELDRDIHLRPPPLSRWRALPCCTLVFPHNQLQGRNPWRCTTPTMWRPH